ncbi:MAG: hypothetical protein WAN36_07405 [Calditrichia bacterium]
MSNTIHISVKCPNCSHSLMNEDKLIDELPAIEMEAKSGDRLGKIFLSQEYGSYNKDFSEIPDVVGQVVGFSCPQCHQQLPVVEICECKAPMVGLQLLVGGKIKICSRNGCKRHALEFEDINDAFVLLMRGDETRLG